MPGPQLNALRERAAAFTRWDTGAPQFTISRWIFLRLLGLIYLIAFVSLWTQIDGLIGSNGIQPAADFLNAVRQQLGAERYWRLPTLCWLAPGDAMLHALCVGGVLLSLLVTVGIAPMISLILLWAFYLSLSTVAGLFLGYQWDTLLLEVGFLAILYAPGGWWPRLAQETPPSRLARWLLWWLLFRLMFMSGAVKLLSNDDAWWGPSALTMHYETQCIPARLGWWAHQLPGWFHTVSCAVMFVIELGAPFLIFCGRICRRIASGLFVGVMLLIALTGNYCFFNLLTIALSLTLLDDDFLKRILPARFLQRLPNSAPVESASATRLALVASFGSVILIVSATEPFARLLQLSSVPRPCIALLNWTAPFRSINSYGLFAVMTKTRPEIIVEGSNDGQTWFPYEFKWKAGDLKRPPGYVAPHQPRLDWQMWFAALQDVRGNQWFVNFLVRLLQGSPPVLGLLEKNPFPTAPPRYVRALLYEYHFTDPFTRAKTGEWWRRELKGEYCPVLSLNRDPRKP